MSRDDQMTKITVEYKGCRRELEAKSAMVVVTLEDDIAAAAEEAYCVDFGARDEIARIAEDLGVDADI